MLSVSANDRPRELNPFESAAAVATRKGRAGTKLNKLVGSGERRV